jgi:hypothetical protein
MSSYGSGPVESGGSRFAREEFGSTTTSDNVDAQLDAVFAALRVMPDTEQQWQQQLAYLRASVQRILGYGGSREGPGGLSNRYISDLAPEEVDRLLARAESARASHVHAHPFMHIIVEQLFPLLSIPAGALVYVYVAHVTRAADGAVQSAFLWEFGVLSWLTYACFALARGIKQKRDKYFPDEQLDDLLRYWRRR